MSTHTLEALVVLLALHAVAKPCKLTRQASSETPARVLDENLNNERATFPLNYQSVNTSYTVVRS